MTLDLTPKKVRFIISVAISVVLTVIAIVIQYVHITGGATHGGFEILLVGYLVLLAGACLEESNGRVSSSVAGNLTWRVSWTRRCGSNDAPLLINTFNLRRHVRYETNTVTRPLTAQQPHFLIGS